LIVAIILTGCAQGERPHHRGGPGGEAMGMGAGMGRGQCSQPGAAARRIGTADADAVLFASFDRDGDLLISTPELEAGIAREFARADANHDHVIDPAEYQAWSMRALGGIYPPYRLDMDRNADGKITFEEFAAELRARAHSYDSNGDGVIEHADLVHPQGGDELQLLTPQQGAPSDGEDSAGPRRRRSEP
jgi:hypothetical protein